MKYWPLQSDLLPSIRCQYLVLVCLLVGHRNVKEFAVKCCTAALCRCPPRMARLIQACWAHRPRDRPSAAEVAKELTLTITQLEVQ